MKGVGVRISLGPRKAEPEISVVSYQIFYPYITDGNKYIQI